MSDPVPTGSDSSVPQSADSPARSGGGAGGAGGGRTQGSRPGMCTSCSRLRVEEEVVAAAAAAAAVVVFPTDRASGGGNVVGYFKLLKVKQET